MRTKYWLSNRLMIAISFVLLFILGCKKNTFTSNPNAQLHTNVESVLHFDTVFTSVGSVTKIVKIYNDNNQKLKLSKVQLMGGTNSYFKINVDGTAGTVFNNVELEANDSLYVFVKVTIDPSAAALPFLVQDSILISYNGNTSFVYVDAYGRNAYFLKNKTISKDTTWTDTKPIVILGGLTIKPNVTLTIAPNTNIYLHADAAFTVNGTLKALGKTDSTRIVFQGDRLDNPYVGYPGSWQGLTFNDSCINNILSFVTIKNAYQGVNLQYPARNLQNKLTMSACILDNIYDAGIAATYSTLSANNCLISNCGSNVSIKAGGVYSFNQCTIVSYDNTYVPHKYPVFSANNYDVDDKTYALQCLIFNSIIYGYGGLPDDEIIVSKKSTTQFYNCQLTNSLFRVKNSDPANTTLSRCIKNVSPKFLNIDIANRVYNFRLDSASSPCIGVADITTALPTNIQGKTRTTKDIGCY